MSSPKPPATPSPNDTSPPSPSQTVSAWSGLRWSSGVVRRSDATGDAVIFDILPWGDGYVGVGSVNHAVGGDDAAFFTSTDGLRWSITTQMAQSAAQEDSGPRFLAHLGNGILAVSDNDGFAPPNLWRTADGSHWSIVNSASWRDAWTNGNLLAVAGGPSGLVAIGSEGLSLMEPGPPIIVSSSDGLTWTRLVLPSSFDHAVFGDLLAYGGGFVIAGRDGEPDATPQHGGAPGVGKPAAWISADGLTWTAADVDGKAVAGGELSAISAGPDGLFAEGRTDASRILSGWSSTDGARWRLIGKVGTNLPDLALVAGDGTHLVMFGRTSCKTTALTAWISGNGTTWTPLVFSGSSAIPAAVAGPICDANGVEGWTTGGMTISAAVVLPDGVLVVGSGGLPQEFWMATAIRP
ncbi:MAG: hypothetical protein ACHQ3P_04595 [Candidatus Limnocylindrales bacterium]